MGRWVQWVSPPGGRLPVPRCQSHRAALPAGQLPITLPRDWGSAPSSRHPSKATIPLL